MRLVADENCDFLVVVDLRSAGYDVVYISECMAGADDEAVIDFARSERRLLVTEDKDFGQLVFAAAKEEFRSDTNPLSGDGSIRVDRRHPQAPLRER